MSLLIKGTLCNALHFVGILGSGMSAIAQYCAWMGLDVSGSDRSCGKEEVADVQKGLESIGCKIFPQDGSGITQTDGIIISTAIEDTNPDIRTANETSIPIFHRSDALAAIVSANRTISIAGTSGKSTVVAMVFELLLHCNKSPSLITGAGLNSLAEKGYIGNAWYGDSDLLVIEADESDGTLVKYNSELGVILNISKDHQSVEEVLQLFKTFAAQSQTTIKNADDPGLVLVTADKTFGAEKESSIGKVQIECTPQSSNLTINSIHYTVPVPGYHNALNALAAICVCKHYGCESDALKEAIKQYKGIKRRFTMYTTKSGVIVVDDYAHNPSKVIAAINTAQRISKKVIALFQPHGFGPTWFLKDEFIASFEEVLRADDVLILLPIYYAGGTVTKDISSGDIAEPLREESFKVYVSKKRDDAIGIIRNNVKAGDCVLSMGARDPSLELFYKDIIEALK